MKMLRTAVVVAALGAAAAAAPGSARATDPSPTCSDLEFLDIENHGEHIVGDYVTGSGHDDLEWPPRGGTVGEAVSALGGAFKPGASGIKQHAPAAPGASFCTDSNSPGAHFPG